MFIGREEELDQLGELLGDEPLVHIRGAWGVGKTALLREFASRLDHDLPMHPTYFVELEGARTAKQVRTCIARDMSLGSSEERAIVVALREHRSPLLILDACDGLEAEACRWLRELSNRSLQTTIFYASRRSLPLEALSFELRGFPNKSGAPRSTSATRLLETATENLVPQVVIDAAQAQRICAELRGNPRAIRFAAGLLSTVSVETLLHKLDRGEFAQLLLEDAASAAWRKTFEKNHWVTFSDAEREVLTLIASSSAGVTEDGLRDLYSPFPASILGALSARALIENLGGRLLAAPLIAPALRHLAPELCARIETRWQEYLYTKAEQNLSQIISPRVSTGRSWFLAHVPILRWLARSLEQQAVLEEKHCAVLAGTSMALRISGRAEPEWTSENWSKGADQNLKARLLAEAGRAAIESGDFEGFSARMKNAEALVGSVPNDELRTDLFRVIAVERWWRTGKIPSGDELTAEGATQNVDRFQGLVAYRRGDAEAAKKHYQRWADDSSLREDGPQQALALVHVCKAESYCENTAAAEVAAHQAIEVADALGAPLFKGFALMQFSEVRFRQRTNSEAAKLIAQARAIFSSLGNSVPTADAAIYDGDYRLVRGLLDEAESQYRTAILYFGDHASGTRGARLRFRLAALEGLRGRPGAARKELEAGSSLLAEGIHEQTIRQAWEALIDRLLTHSEDASHGSEMPESTHYEAVLTQRVLDTPSLVSTTPSRILRVSSSFRHIHAPDGSAFVIRRNSPIRRILKCLVERHIKDSESVIPSEDLLQAGWPGQEPVGRSGSNRLWVTVSRLRALGLEQVLVTTNEGYQIDPAVHIKIDDEIESSPPG